MIMTYDKFRREDGVLQFPDQAVQETNMTTEGRVYLFMGRKSTCGFCVTRKGLPETSEPGYLFVETPA